VASITQLRTAARAVVRGDVALGTHASDDALVLDRVTRAFGALRAVDDVSLSVAAGQKYAVLGSNGAGKTTLFNAITGDFPSASSAKTSPRCRRTSESARACAAPTSRRCCSAT
jgi:branched-chain amino acid transport system ATP-binding protein